MSGSWFTCPSCWVSDADRAFCWTLTIWQRLCILGTKDCACACQCLTVVPARSITGKSFFKKKKQPIPIKLTGKNWGAQVERALGATYLYWGGGNTLTIRIARASFTDEQVCAVVLEQEGPV